MIAAATNRNDVTTSCRMLSEVTECRTSVE